MRFILRQTTLKEVGSGLVYFHDATGQNAYSAHIGFMPSTCQCHDRVAVLNGLCEQTMAIEDA